MLQRLLCRVALTVGMREIQHVRIEHLARCVHDGDLAARAVSGIEPDRGLALDGRLQKQLMQIGGKHADRRFCGLLREHIARFTLHGRPDQPFVSVRAGRAHRVGTRRIAAQRDGRDDVGRLDRVERDADL